MNLKDLIEKKLPINFEQQQSLIALFTKMLPQEKKRHFTDIVRNKMYSSFEGIKGIERIEVREVSVEYRPLFDHAKEIAGMRSNILTKVFRSGK